MRAQLDQTHQHRIVIRWTWYPTSSAEQRQRRHWAAADSTSSRPLGIGGAMYDGIHTLDADSTPQNDTKDRGCVVLPDQASTPAPEYTASTSTPPPPTPTPAPRGLVTDPRALLALISSVPPQTFHSYFLSHLNPANVLIVCSVERRSTTGKGEWGVLTHLWALVLPSPPPLLRSSMPSPPTILKHELTDLGFSSQSSSSFALVHHTLHIHRFWRLGNDPTLDGTGLCLIELLDFRDLLSIRGSI
ncbi:hypothetical protein DFP72DRAFT_1067028 [Ephemerocybe angulata]|uniref:Uncharacterized protein n=1 Tax=Ephemerocybe angulata TaxID=980116 RepID=A0A8H6I077_9AGAR|nr:hypothetical protein DFP72DRAFT_1067028 [Tulosesus angulatus]